jgi:transcription elongation factor Elf1
MKCPLCQSQGYEEIDLTVGQEITSACQCLECGCLWTLPAGGQAAKREDADQPQQTVRTDFLCPTCKHSVSHETDLRAFQFHEELYDCSVCGTVSSVAHGQVEVVKDSQLGSFLDSSSEMVEADDYGRL